MTNRTASLLMLFVAALIATGVLLAIVIALPDGRGASGPWLVPLLAVLCLTTTLYVGRRHILPHSLAESSARSAVALIAMVVITMIGAFGGVWVLQRLLGRALTVPSLILVLWFALLWLAVRQHGRNPGRTP